jgi:hypothetical protein
MTVNGVLQGAQLVSPDGQYPYQHDYIDACIRVLLAFDYIFRHFHFSNLKIVNFYLEKSSDFEVDFCKNICTSAEHRVQEILFLKGLTVVRIAFG